MKDFISVILVLTQISVVVTTLQVYLRINKIWKRKHEEEVAASQSIVGILLLIGNCVLWILYYVWVEPDLLSIVDTSLYLVESAVFLLISTGLWVKSKHSRNIWKLALSALKLERKESTFLLKKMFNRTNAETIVSILHQLAMIDEELDPKEEALILAFAKHWKIDYSIEELNKNRVEGDSYNFIKLRNSLVSFLEFDPPNNQVLQLKSLIGDIIFIDNKVTKEEQLIQDELYGIIDEYSTKGVLAGTLFSVLIVPQQDDHFDVVENVIPNTKRLETSGGIAYSIGNYYSESYAEMVCEEYRKINLFTIVYKLDEDEMKQL